MNLSLHIQSASINTSGADLYIQINSQGMSYIILDGGICVALAIYHFSENTSNETAAGYIHQVLADQPVLQQKYHKVNIIYGYAQSILVPHRFMNEKVNNAMLELLYGDSMDRVARTDFMYKYDTHNLYIIPSVIEMVITRYFAFATYTHLFSVLPEVVNDAGNHMYCIFSTEQFNVLLIREGKLQVMQNHRFKNPDDVSYHLLHLCKSFEVDVQNILVRLSGMIDVSSILYSELYKYFLQIQFDTLPEQYQYPGEIEKKSAHYYSHLFAIAACV